MTTRLMYLAIYLFVVANIVAFHYARKYKNEPALENYYLGGKPPRPLRDDISYPLWIYIAHYISTKCDTSCGNIRYYIAFAHFAVCTQICIVLLVINFLINKGVLDNISFAFLCCWCIFCTPLGMVKRFKREISDFMEEKHKNEEKELSNALNISV